MGIEGFFSWLSGTHIIHNTRYSKETISQVLVDANAKIHEVAQRIIGYGDYEGKGKVNATSRDVLEAFREEIWRILDSISAKEYIFALDGVPPFAKITQQRERRVTSQPIIRDGKVIWDSLWISPYHPFMNDILDILEFEKENTKTHNIRKYFNVDPYIAPKSWKRYIDEAISDKDLSALNKYLKVPIKSISELPPDISNISKQDIIISSHKEPGEGEHKLMRMLDNASKHDIIIMGNDSDMVILSLTQPKDGIFIQYYDRKLEKHFLIRKGDLVAYLKEYKIENIWDFIFISLFVGNDFIKPTLQGLNTKQFLDNALKTYKNKPITMTKKREIITEREEEMRQGKEIFMIKKKDITYEMTINLKAIESFMDSLTIKDDYTETFKYMNDISQTYKKGSKSVNKDISNNLCYNWIEAVRWILNYYVGAANVSKEWSFKYAYGPSILTLRSYVKEMNFQVNTEILDDTQYLDIERHYICIIPYRGLDIIPNSDHIYDQLFDMFPTDYKKIKEFHRRERLLMVPVPLHRIKALKL